MTDAQLTGLGDHRSYENSAEQIAGAPPADDQKYTAAEWNRMRGTVDQHAPLIDNNTQRLSTVIDGTTGETLATLRSDLNGKEAQGIAQQLVDALKVAVDSEFAVITGILSSDNVDFDVVQERVDEIVRLASVLNGLTIPHIAGLRDELDQLQIDALSGFGYSVYGVSDAYTFDRYGFPIPSGVDVLNYYDLDKNYLYSHDPESLLHTSLFPIESFANRRNKAVIGSTGSAALSNMSAVLFCSGGTASGDHSLVLSSQQTCESSGNRTLISASFNVQVSGNTSAALAVSNTSVSGGQSAALAGNLNAVTGNNSAALGGSGNILSGSKSAVLATENSTVEGSKNSAIGSSDITINGSESVAVASYDVSINAGSTRASAAGSEASILGNNTNQFIGGVKNGFLTGANSALIGGDGGRVTTDNSVSLSGGHADTGAPETFAHGSPGFTGATPVGFRGATPTAAPSIPAGSTAFEIAVRAALISQGLAQ